MLDRLAKETGIKCNAHSFRRGFATELRKVEVGELDIIAAWALVERDNGTTVYQSVYLRWRRQEIQAHRYIALATCSLFLCAERSSV